MFAKKEKAQNPSSFGMIEGVNLLYQKGTEISYPKRLRRNEVMASDFHYISVECNYPYLLYGCWFDDKETIITKFGVL